MAQRCWYLVFPFPQVNYSLIIPWQIVLWLISFSWMWSLLRTEYSSIFQNGSSPPPPARTTRGFFFFFKFWEFGQAPGDKAHKIGDFLKIGSWDRQWASSNSSIIVKVSYPGTGSHSGFHSWVYSNKPWLPVFNCSSPLGDDWSLMTDLITDPWGQWFGLCSYLSFRSKEKLIFQTVNSSLVLRTEW